MWSGSQLRTLACPPSCKVASLEAQHSSDLEKIARLGDAEDTIKALRRALQVVTVVLVLVEVVVVVVFCAVYRSIIISQWYAMAGSTCL